MDKLQAIESVAAAIFFATLLWYGYCVIYRGVIPRKASWLVWWALDTITFSTMYAADKANWQIAAAAVGSTLVIPLAFIYGMRGWEKFDIACMSFGVIGLIAWQVFGESTLGIVACQLGTLIAAGPTFKAAWLKPYEDDPNSWMLFFISCVLLMYVVLAGPDQSLAKLAQPITFTIIETVMVVLLWIAAPLRRMKYTYVSRKD